MKDDQVLMVPLKLLQIGESLVKLFVFFLIVVWLIYTGVLITAI